MIDQQAPPDPAAALVDPHGQPLARAVAASKKCPRCKAGQEKRVASGGFGAVHPVCGECGYEFHGEPWRGDR